MHICNKQPCLTYVVRQSEIYYINRYHQHAVRTYTKLCIHKTNVFGIKTDLETHIKFTTIMCVVELFLQWLIVSNHHKPSVSAKVWYYMYIRHRNDTCAIHINSSPLDKMAAISQTVFSDAFSWMKSFIFWSNFYWSLFLRVQLTIFLHWFR